MKPITYPCPRCQGKGSLPLPAHLFVVLEVLETAERLSSRDLADRLQTTIQTMCNRLTALQELGLVDRRGPFAHPTGGLEYQWTLTAD